MATYVLVNAAGVIDNIIEWDGESPIDVAEGEAMWRCLVPAGIGWRWDAGRPVDPNPEPEHAPPAPIVPGGPAIVA